jgi:dTDP-4-amino-4,6-dideoxygalactose transaminase
MALDLALYAMGIGRGHEVVVTPRTFMASVSCIVNAGAKPVFADVKRKGGDALYIFTYSTGRTY